MSGGGSSQPVQSSSSDASKDGKFSGYIAPEIEIQPFFPGQDGLLAQQIAAGFGSTPQEVSGLLNSLYSPMQIGLGTDGTIYPGGTSVGTSESGGESDWSNPVMLNDYKGHYFGVAPEWVASKAKVTDR